MLITSTRHNFHTLTNFFTAVRESIAKGTFEVDRARFEEVYDNEMPEKTGEGPRYGFSLSMQFYFSSTGLLNTTNIY